MTLTEVLSTADKDGQLSISAADLKALIESSTLSADLNGVTKSGKRKSPKKVKDPLKPKRGKSAYLFYTHSDETKAAFKEAHPDKWDAEKCQPKPIVELTKFASKIWKDMSEEDKAPYTASAALEKERYDSEMAEYRPTPSVVAALDESDTPDAPEGWSGPFAGYYLFKNASGRKTYRSFADAVAAAEDVEDCGGITKTAQGMYSLRKMEGGQPIPTDKPAISWVKGEVEVTKMVVSPPSSKKAVTKKESVGDDEGDGEGDAMTEEPDVFGEDTADEDFDPDDDDEDDSPEVARWTYEDTEYLVDEASGLVYDANKFENEGEVVEIGSRVPNNSDGKFVEK